MVITVLIVEWQLPDFDDAELEACGRNLRECVRHFSIDRILSQAAYDHGDGACLIHVMASLA